MPLALRLRGNGNPRVPFPRLPGRPVSLHTMATIDGIFYAQRGQGTPLICLHGAGGTHRHWGELFAPLSATARLIAPDLPGHGRSALPGRATIADYAAVALHLLDALELERAVLAGHSMGAAAALEAALAAPERVRGLALIGASARLRVAPELLQALAADPDAAIERLVQWIYAEPAAHLRAAAAAEFRQCDPVVLRGDFAACDGWDARARLGSLRCPALVICGEADRMTPPKLARELQALLDGELVLLPGVGHMPMLEAPAATATALRAWLEGL